MLGAFILLLILLILLIFCYQNYMFKQTTYHKITHHSFLATKFNLGRNGEYLTYKYLKSYENKGGKFLFNCYLPKDNGETTEIDVLLINEGGIFCFESKNYSGWIFGDEKSKMWTQTLPQGKGRSRKERFFNPIMQNKVHIKWLKQEVGADIPIHSIIVFSERCTLKKVNVQSPNVFVVNRNYIASVVKKINKQQVQKLSPEMINALYNTLYVYTQVSDTVKEKHISNIESNWTHKSHNLKDDRVITEKMEKIGQENEETFEEIHLVQVDSSIEKQQNITDLNTSDICPRCGAPLVLRIAKRGEHAGNQFYGCSSYPKCRFIKNL